VALFASSRKSARVPDVALEMTTRPQHSWRSPKLITNLSPITEHFTSRLLHGFPRPDVNAILAAASRRRFLANSVIVNQEDSADRFFLLVEGRARYFLITETGQKIILFWLTRGEVFGGAALLSDPTPYLVSTETVRESSTLVWDRATIRRLVTQYPRLMENALSIAFDYFVWYRATHVALTCHTARQRLAQVLTHLALGLGHKVVGGVELDVTNEELANAANVTAFTTSRLMSEWQRKGAVSKSRGKILLNHPERLFFSEI
jgi:CRP/FNR family transcriptional regulator, nitrogen oxide reductase regulator